MTLPTRFDSSLYQEFRPEYPEALFSNLLQSLATRGTPLPRSVLDAGCGTGKSLETWRRLLPSARILGVDRDPAMLESARALHPQVEFSPGTAEALPVRDGEFDLLLAGSAFHWFDRERFSSEAWRILSAGGTVFIFEYQFPRAPSNPGLNEWVRRRFNQEWKAPGQVPRGSLKELVRVFREPAWRELTVAIPLLRQKLGADELYGQIISQSRYLHSEAALTPERIQERRLQLRGEVQTLFDSDSLVEFDFHLSGFAFQKSGPPSTSR